MRCNRSEFRPFFGTFWRFQNVADINTEIIFWQGALGYSNVADLNTENGISISNRKSYPHPWFVEPPWARDWCGSRVRMPRIKQVRPPDSSDGVRVCSVGCLLFLAVQVFNLSLPFGVHFFFSTSLFVGRLKESVTTLTSVTVSWSFDQGFFFGHCHCHGHGYWL